MRRKYDKYNRFTKQQMRQLLWNWKRYHRIIENKGEQSLTHEYHKPSKVKQNAWNYCCRLCQNNKGFGLSIISANRQRFIAGFQYYDDDRSLMFCHITKEHDWFVSVDDLIEFDKLIQREQNKVED